MFFETNGNFILCEDLDIIWNQSTETLPQPPPKIDIQ